MAITTRPEPSRILNSVCPVCGAGISPDMPSVELHPGSKRHGLSVLVRVDCGKCGDAAARQPDRYLEAAVINQVG